jgi:glycosyltransferase involved in cell wall biosynthesis
VEDKIKILFVAFEFPPLGGAGVQRSLNFVKYLPENQICPIVITVKEGDYKHVMASHPMDESLCKEIPAGTIIKRIHCPGLAPAKNKFHEWARIYFSVTGDFKDLWKEALDKALPAIIDQYKPRAIYVTLPPFIMARLWLRYIKQFKLPLIIDFRDAWSQWCISANATYFHYLLKLRFEKRVLYCAAKVICSSKQIMEDLMQVHPTVDSRKFSVIHNGYNTPLMMSNQLRIAKKDKVIIGYVGAFYYTPKARGEIFKPWWKKPLHRMFNYVPRKEDWLYRSPYFFFKAIKEIISNNPGLADKIEIRFAGDNPNWLTAQIKEFGLQQICSHAGYLSHEAVISFQQECDALLITSSKVINGRDYSIAGKTYEYFSMGKPIVAFVCDGAQKDILHATGMALVCDPDDTKMSAVALSQMFLGEMTLYPNIAEIKKYHRKALTKLLADAVGEVV